MSARAAETGRGKVRGEAELDGPGGEGEGGGLDGFAGAGPDPAFMAMMGEEIRRPRGLAPDKGKEHPLTLQAMNNLATLYMMLGKRDRAEPLAVEALATRRRVLGAEHPQTLMSMHNLARLYHQQGKLAEAERLAGESLEVHRRTLGKEHPGTLASLYTLAIVRRALGKPAEAEPLFAELVATRRQSQGASTRRWPGPWSTSA